MKFSIELKKINVCVNTQGKEVNGKPHVKTCRIFWKVKYERKEEEQNFSQIMKNRGDLGLLYVEMK